MKNLSHTEIEATIEAQRMATIKLSQAAYGLIGIERRMFDAINNEAWDEITGLASRMITAAAKVEIQSKAIACFQAILDAPMGSN